MPLKSCEGTGRRHYLTGIEPVHFFSDQGCPRGLDAFRVRLEPLAQLLGGDAQAVGSGNPGRRVASSSRNAATTLCLDGRPAKNRVPRSGCGCRSGLGFFLGMLNNLLGCKPGRQVSILHYRGDG